VVERAMQFALVNIAMDLRRGAALRKWRRIETLSGGAQTAEICPCLSNFHEVSCIVFKIGDCS